MLDIYHCLTHVRCLAVCGICWPCTHPMHWVLDKTCRWCENLYPYRQPSVWFKDVFYLHSVHFVHIVASIYAESCFMLLTIFYWFSVIYSFFPFCIAGEFGKLLCPMLCAFFASSISAKRKRWFNDCFSCFYLFYTIKFIICAIKMCKIQCVWSFNGVPPLLFLLIYLYILYKTCVWYVYNSYIYSYRPMFAHSEPMNMILKHKAEGYSLQKLFLGVLEAVHWRHLQAVIVLQR